MASSEFLEGSSLSDPMEAICRVTSKNCVQKEYVLAYVWPKTLLCHFNVPDASWTSLAQDKGRGHVILCLRGGREG